MKICNKCKINKNLSEYHKRKSSKDGVTNFCKECKSYQKSEYRKTKQGVIASIYDHEKGSSITRGHNQPTYTLSELSLWLTNDWIFDLLYTNWVNCGYLKDMKPSIDRIDDDKGYSFKNIQIMTWGENKTKANIDIRSGKLTHGNKPQKAVLQFTKDGKFIKEFVSSNEAYRQTNIHVSSISECCLGKRNSAGGFKWGFKNESN